MTDFLQLFRQNFAGLNRWSSTISMSDGAASPSCHSTQMRNWSLMRTLYWLLRLTVSVYFNGFRCSFSASAGTAVRSALSETRRSFSAIRRFGHCRPEVVAPLGLTQVDEVRTEATMLQASANQDQVRHLVKSPTTAAADLARLMAPRQGTGRSQARAVRVVQCSKFSCM